MWLGRVLSGDLRPRARDALLDDEALRALDRCIALDGERVECRLQKVRLLLAATGASTASLGRDEDDDEFGSRGAKRKRAKQKSGSSKAGGAASSWSPEDIWALAEDSLLVDEPVRSFLHVPYFYSCVAPAVAAQAAIAAGPAVRQELGPPLLHRAAETCAGGGVPDEAPDFVQRLAGSSDSGRTLRRRRRRWRRRRRRRRR